MDQFQILAGVALIIVASSGIWAVAVTIKNRDSHSNWRLKFKLKNDRDAASLFPGLKLESRGQYYQNKQSVPINVTLEITSGDRRITKTWRSDDGAQTKGA